MKEGGGGGGRKEPLQPRLWQLSNRNASEAAIEAQSNLNRTAVTRITKFSKDFFHFCLIAARASVALVN